MTKPAPETLEREKGKLFVTDAELMRRLGVPDEIARPAIAMLDRDPTSRFPRKQKMWGDRRYWPAVLAFFDRENGIVANDAARLIPERRIPHPAAASTSTVRTLPRRGTP